jgi:short-subunit dehydrogenase
VSRVDSHAGRPAPRPAARGRGGIILVSSIAAQGVPYAANYAATKSYPLDMIQRFGADQTPMGRMAMPTHICVRDALTALRTGRPVRVSGRFNRATLALTPRTARVRIFGAMNRSMAARTAAALHPPGSRRGVTDSAA